MRKKHLTKNCVREGICFCEIGTKDFSCFQPETTPARRTVYKKPEMRGQILRDFYCLGTPTKISNQNIKEVMAKMLSIVFLDNNY